MGAAKAVMPWWKTLWLGVLAGVYLSFGGALILFVGGQVPQILQTNPGLKNLLFGFVGLPFGLALIVICGGELYTSNAAFMPAAMYEGRCTIFQLLKNWFFSFFGNLAGSLIIVWFLDETLLLPAGSAARNGPEMTSMTKTHLDWGSTLIRGVFCNWLVCLGVWQATAAQDIASKILALLFPIGAFVAIGFEHVIANMFIIPMGMKLGNGVSVGRYIWHSMIPVFIGNTISAAFFVAGSYAFCYGTLPTRIGQVFGKGHTVPDSTSSLDEHDADDTAHGHTNSHKSLAAHNV
jgi:formate/nitrite transporter